MTSSENDKTLALEATNGIEASNGEETSNGKKDPKPAERDSVNDQALNGKEDPKPAERDSVNDQALNGKEDPKPAERDSLNDQALNGKEDPKSAERDSVNDQALNGKEAPKSAERDSVNDQALNGKVDPKPAERDSLNDQALNGKEDPKPAEKDDVNDQATDQANKEMSKEVSSNGPSMDTAIGEQASDETDGGVPAVNVSATSESANKKTLPEKPATEEAMSAEQKARKMEDDYNALGAQRCPNCVFMTDEEDLYRVHITTCTKKARDGQILLQFNEGIYKCKSCDLDWGNKGEFDEHIVCHISDDPYVCMSCRRHFSSRQLIEQHARQDHPTGDSRCGLRGIKRGRQFVEELEQTGSLTLFGKLKIPKTPRTVVSNKLVVTPTTTASNPPNLNSTITSAVPSRALSVAQAILVEAQKNPSRPAQPLSSGNTGHQILPMSHQILTSVQTISVTSTPVFLQKCPGKPVLNGTEKTVPMSQSIMSPIVSTSQNKLYTESLLTVSPSQQAPLTDPRNLASKVRPILQKLQSIVSSNTSSSGSPVKIAQSPTTSNTSIGGNVVSPPVLISQPVNSVNSLFGIVDKVTGQFEQAPIPSPIQKVVVPQTSQKSSVGIQNHSPQYHVKHITEYTTGGATPTTPTTSVANPQQLILIPVGSVFHPMPQKETNQQTQILRNTLGVNNAPIPIQVIPNPTSQALVSLNNIQQRAPLPVNTQIMNHQSINQDVPVRQQPIPVLMQQSPQNQLVFVQSGTQQAPVTSHNLPARVEVDSRPVQIVSTTTIQSPTTPVLTKAPLPQMDPPSYLETMEKIKQNISNNGGGPTTVITGPIQQPGAALQAVSKTQGTRYMFRIKPGNGFVCEACRKFTKDELIYKNHIWNHFHIDQQACHSCTPDDVFKRQVHRCQLVNKIVCNLIKRCSYEIQKMISGNMNSNEVINISDDEEDTVDKVDPGKSESGTEVIVLDDEDSGNCLQIRIDSTCTISEAEYTSEGGKAGTLAEIDDNKQQGDIKQKKDHDVAYVDNKQQGDSKEKKDHDVAYVDNKQQGDSKEKKDHDVDFVETEISHKFDEKEKKDSPDENVAKTDEAVCNVEENCLQENDKKEENPVENKQCEAPVQETSLSAVCSTNDQEENSMLAEEPSRAFYMCAYEHCSFTAFNPTKYKSHLLEKHLDEYNFVCCHCGMKDFTIESHIRHMHTHASAKSFALYCCPVRLCSYKSNLLQYYICHLNAHRPEDVNLKCTYCHKFFENTEKLQHHLKKNLLEFVNCHYCPFKFSGKNAILHHIRNSHKDKPRMVTVTSQIVCLEREINFYNPPTARSDKGGVAQTGNQSESLNIPAIMELLQKESSSTTSKEESIQGNMKAVKSNDTEAHKQLKSITKSDVEKKKNKSSKNIGPKSLLCPHCNYLSYNVSLHARHIAIHEEEPDRDKRFVCNFCPTATDYIGAFKKHVANHLGRHEIKFYCCTLCQHSTNLKSHIMDHCQDYHDGAAMHICTTEVVISTETTCKYCDFKSRQADQVVLHEKLAHESQPTIPLDRHEADIAGSSASVSSGETTREKTKSHDPSTKKYKYHCEYCSMFFKHKVQLVTHLEESHEEIEDKNFTYYKCKYCPLYDTRKEVIISHLDNEHSGKEIKILRKIEKIQSKRTCAKESVETDKESSSLEEVPIPDGNVFKVPFKCPKCQFSTLMRLSAMRHIKEHPNLKPVREKDASTTRKTARKSTSNKKQVDVPKLHSSLYQPTSKLKENPFTAVKEAVDKLKDTEKSSKSTYNLGDNDLHDMLSACYTPIEKDVKFKCKICRQDIIKKFVLHRHILDHLKVVFFKCKYCAEGSVEKTLLFGHIQKIHSQQPRLYHELGKDEVDVVIRERIIEHDLIDTSEKVLEPSYQKPEKQSCDNGSVSKSPKAVKRSSDSKMSNKDDDESRSYKCTFEGCRYTSKRNYIMEFHLLSHGDPTKNYKCSVCDYRQIKDEVARHIKKHETERSVFVEPIKDKETLPIATAETNTREGSVDTLDSVLSGKDGAKYLTTVKGKKVKIGSITLSNNILYEMKKVFKCKICGEKTENISGMYKHLQTTRCKRPAYRCSFCSFQRYTKVDIVRHAKIRHPGQKLEIKPLPRSSKFKSLKIPIKHNFVGQNTDESKGTKKKDKTSASTNEKVSKSLNKVTNKEEGIFNKGDDFPCGLCRSFSSDSIMKLQFHINTVHDGQLLYCKTCQYKTPLIKHMINHCKHVHLQKCAQYKVETETSFDQTSQENADSPKYQCTMCSTVTQHKNKMRLHYYKHFNYKPSVCGYCKKQFASSHRCKDHTTKVHPGKPVKYRQVVNASIEKKVEKILSDTKGKNSKEIKVEKCSPKPQSKKRRLEFDSETERQKGKQLKTASTAGYSPNKDILEEGQIAGGNHSPIKYQVCLDGNGKRIFKCSRCSYTSTEKDYLRKHMLSHGSRLFKCCYCSFSSKMKCNAYRHCLNIHKDREPKILDKKTSTIIKPDTLELEQHKGFSQSDQRLTKQTKVSRYNCCICFDCIDGLNNFKSHLSIHPEFQDTPVNFDVQVLVTNCRKQIQSESDQSEIDTSSESVTTNTKMSFQGINKEQEKSEPINDQTHVSDKEFSNGSKTVDDFTEKMDVSNCLEQSDSPSLNNDSAKQTKEHTTVSKTNDNITLDDIETGGDIHDEEQRNVPDETMIKPSDISELPDYSSASVSDSCGQDTIERTESLGFEVNKADDDVIGETEANSTQTIEESANVFEEVTNSSPN